MNADNNKEMTKKSFYVFLVLVVVTLSSIISKITLPDIIYLIAIILCFSRYVYLKRT